MSENIHNDDELYRKAYKNFENEPSLEVWDKLQARLDQKDADVYRAKFVWWKRIAVVLFFLIGSAAAYEIFFRPTTSTSAKVNQEAKNITDTTFNEHYRSIQDSNNVADTLNKAEANTHSIKQNSRQVLQQSNSNATITAFRIQTTKKHVFANKTDAMKVIAKEQDIANNKQLSITNSSDVVVLAQNDKQENLKSLLKEDSVIASKRSQEEQEISVLNNNITNSDSATTNQHADTVLATNKMLDSVDKNVAIIDKESPVKTTKSFKPHFSFSPYIATDFTGDQIDNDEHHRDPDRRNDRHEIKGREENQFSFSTGILVRYHPGRNISLKSGLIYSNTAIRINPETLYATHDNNQSISYKYVSSLGYAYVKPSFDQSPFIGDSISSEAAEQHASYLSIPLMAGYRINAGKKLTLLPGIGFTTNVLMGSKLETALKKNTDQTNITIKKLQGLKPVFFSFAVDAELHYLLSNNFNLLLLPSFRHAIVPTTSNHVVKTYPYNFGLGLGITYGL